MANNVGIECIYLCEPGDSISDRWNLYKIGHTYRDVWERIKEYGLGTKLYFSVICPNSKILENELKKYFDTMYLKERDEYYYGNVTHMAEVMMAKVNEHCKLFRDPEQRQTVCGYWKYCNNVVPPALTEKNTPKYVELSRKFKNSVCCRESRSNNSSDRVKIKQRRKHDRGSNKSIMSAAYGDDKPIEIKLERYTEHANNEQIEIKLERYTEHANDASVEIKQNGVMKPVDKPIDDVNKSIGHNDSKLIEISEKPADDANKLIADDISVEKAAGVLTPLTYDNNQESKSYRRTVRTYERWAAYNNIHCVVIGAYLYVKAIDEPWMILDKGNVRQFVESHKREFVRDLRVFRDDNFRSLKMKSGDIIREQCVNKNYIRVKYDIDAIIYNIVANRRIDAFMLQQSTHEYLTIDIKGRHIAFDAKHCKFTYLSDLAPLRTPFNYGSNKSIMVKHKPNTQIIDSIMLSLTNKKKITEFRWFIKTMFTSSDHVIFESDCTSVFAQLTQTFMHRLYSTPPTMEIKYCIDRGDGCKLPDGCSIIKICKEIRHCETDNANLYIAENSVKILNIIREEGGDINAHEMYDMNCMKLLTTPELLLTNLIMWCLA